MDEAVSFLDEFLGDEHVEEALECLTRDAEGFQKAGTAHCFPTSPFEQCDEYLPPQGSQRIA